MRLALITSGCFSETRVIFSIRSKVFRLMIKWIITFAASFGLSIGILSFYSLSKTNLLPNGKMEQISNAFLISIDISRSQAIFRHYLSGCCPYCVGKDDEK